MFTQEEVNWLANVFRMPEMRPDPLHPKAVETTLRIQSIIRKMTELQEKENELERPQDRVAGDTDQYQQPNGNRKAKATRQNGAAVSK